MAETTVRANDYAAGRPPPEPPGRGNARNVFFSFHWDHDVDCAMNVRNSSRFVSDENVVGWYDQGVWEEAKIKGQAEIKRLIDNGLKHTSVVVALIGTHTAERKWVDYEVRTGWDSGKGVLGVRIHGIRNLARQTSRPGPNPFDNIPMQGGGTLARYVKVHDWILDDGRNNLGAWVEQAAMARGR